jgi:predicted RNA-binding protein with PUA-like domain
MGLAELTSRQAVLDAIAEFDRLGRDVFLDKYGFGRAREYFLVVGGREYDSKAIAGAAHGYQFPRDGALDADAFSGGDATVRRKLAELGFSVERSSSRAERLTDGYWVFVCNPRKWAIDRFLERGTGQRDTWGIRPSDSSRFAPGQLAIIRVGVDRRSFAELQGRPKLDAGIYALCEIESLAYAGAGANDAFWAPDAARAPGWPTVDVVYLRNYLHRPLTIAQLEESRPGLPRSLLQGLQASSFPISRNDFLAVLELLGEEPESLAGTASEPPATADMLAKLEEQYLGAVPEVRERVSRSVERGPVGNAVKRANGFRCLLCEALGRDPIGFRKPNGEPYVEAHHVMPVARGEIGSLAASNVITVCANHHRELHYGCIGLQVMADRFDLGLPSGRISIPRRALPKM